MDFWSGARRFWTKLGGYIWPLADPVVKQMKIFEGPHLHCKMMEPDVLTTVECLVINFDL